MLSRCTFALTLVALALVLGSQLAATAQDSLKNVKTLATGTSNPPLLAIWGKNEPFFVPAGAKAFQKDMPGAKVEFLEAGQFALETHVEEISLAIHDFLEAIGVRRDGTGAA